MSAMDGGMVLLTHGIWVMSHVFLRHAKHLFSNHLYLTVHFMLFAPGTPNCKT